MLFTDVIRRKRDGGELGAEEIAVFVRGLADGSLPAEQVSSLAMAIFLNSMSFDEAAKLTLAMANSGTVLDWDPDTYAAPIVDKHSTGGVGDKVSLALAPALVACGAEVPMISGRGLGHTGGTTDKAEAIPGYNTAPDFETFKSIELGWTPGMRLLGIRIGQESDGRLVSRRQGLVRWLLLGLPALLVSLAVYVPNAIGLILGALGAVWLLALLYTMAQSPSKQGLHDRIGIGQGSYTT